MDLVILGRAISGTGGAGMMSMASIVITGMYVWKVWEHHQTHIPVCSDLVPKRELAAWRSYVNLVLTLGRSLGGPVGGWLTDSVGWRWFVNLFPS